jgi:bifunctional non-homologous end joining protein LigD
LVDDLALRSYVKTSGASGLHIYVPLIENTFTHDQVRLFGAGIAKAVADRRPDMATIERLIRNRTGKVYIDYTQNGRARTLASVYSPRARAGAPVSSPLRWDELQSEIDPRQFTMDTVLKRVKKFGDLFESVLWDRQDITPFLNALKRRA